MGAPTCSGVCDCVAQFDAAVQHNEKNTFMVLKVSRHHLPFEVEGFYFERPTPDDGGGKQPLSGIKLRCGAAESKIN